MKNIPDKSIDMILCDLPYGKTKHENDKPLPFDLLWREYRRIIKTSGAILLFGQGTFFVDLVNSNRKLFRYDLVWNKHLTTGFLNAHKMPLRQHEQIAVFYKKLPTYNPQFAKGKPLHSRGTAYKRKEAKNQNYGEFGTTDDVRAGSTDKFPTSMLSFAKPHPSIAVHRTEKPVDLLEYLIKTYTNEGDTVLDNCMGSGSTGVACKNTGRRFIGIELCDDYFKIAKERIEAR
jgi:DNA modification methylase